MSAVLMDTQTSNLSSLSVSSYYREMSAFLASIKTNNFQKVVRGDIMDSDHSSKSDHWFIPTSDIEYVTLRVFKSRIQIQLAWNDGNIFSRSNPSVPLSKYSGQSTRLSIPSGTPRLIEVSENMFPISLIIRS